MYQYDYLIVGAGLYGAVMAHELHKKGKHCLVIDRRGSYSRKYLLRGNRRNPCPQVWGTYFSYFKQKGVGLYQPVC